MPKYTNAPLQEIICEFRFEPSHQWDIVYPGLVYERVKARFPKRKQIQNVAFSVDGKQNQTVTRTPRVQFLQEDEKVLLQVGENLLAINQLAPYEGWASFRPVIDEAMQAYMDVARPKAIARLGLRYVNHVKFAEPKIRLEEYFRVFPECPDTFGTFLDFDLNLILDCATSTDGLRCHFGLLPTEVGTGLLLDFDHFTRGAAPLPLEKFGEWLELAHRKVDDSFEHALTEKLKERLK